jgi:hypothetical protein
MKDEVMTTPYVLYRDSTLSGTPELDTIVENVAASSDVEGIPSGSVVFPRFRSIPFGKELNDSVKENGSTLVNSWDEYLYVSNLYAWVADLGDLTPAAYTVNDIPTLPEGEYFIKGETNSVKHEWMSSAFAPDLASVDAVVTNLRKHNVVGSQELVIRPFVRYRQLAVMESGQPVFNEWRVFILNGKVMATGFYWSQQIHRFDADDIQPLIPSEFQKVIDLAIERVGSKISFVVIDIAEKPNGTWQVIELNDGNMSGLCGVDAEKLWANIAASY